MIEIRDLVAAERCAMLNCHSILQANQFTSTLSGGQKKSQCERAENEPGGNLHFDDDSATDSAQQETGCNNHDIHQDLTLQAQGVSEIEDCVEQDHGGKITV